MQESFLHYIWQFQHFEKTDLCTTANDQVSIIKQGVLNKDSGPDFSSTKIRIGNIEWIGDTEIHIKSSDWLHHKHSNDPAYEKVVLHVVWDADTEIRRHDGTLIPTIELKDRVSKELLDRYFSLINGVEEIPCKNHLVAVNNITRIGMLDKAMMQRLESKAEKVLALYEKNGQDWEETTYQLLAQNFGFKINSEAFLQLSRTLPYKIVAKHSDNLLQIEALLFGQAGFLDDACDDPYLRLLKREYSFLRHKYQLNDIMVAHQWKFLRMRPANFPTIRIAQLASLLYEQKNLFAMFLYFTSSEAIIKRLSVCQSAYWREHFTLGKKAKNEIPGLGKSSIYNILINTVAPLLTAYGKAREEQLYIDRAIDLLYTLPAEDNHITRIWKSLAWPVKSAFDSQSLTELYNNFCKKKGCLSCTIGVSLVREERNEVLV